VYKRQSNINTELEGIHTILEAAGLDGAEDGIKNLQTRVNELDEKLTAIIGEYTSMVTSVDLFISNYQNAYRNNIPDNKLQFIFVPQEKTVKFPLNEEAADAQFEFSVENKNVTTTDSLVIRVSPTNAVLDPSNVSLITSQGKDLSEYVEVKSVKRFNTLLTQTRSADEGNGLWTVEFAVKEGVDLAKLAEEVAVKRGNYSYAIEYAVAVKNTQSADTRRVISSYDVEVQPSDYEPATDKILVENRDGIWKDVDNVRNRFYFDNDKDFGAKSIETKQSKKDIPEYKWENFAEPQIEGTTAGRILAVTDQRYTKNFPLVEVGLGQDININVASFLDEKENLPVDWVDMNGKPGSIGWTGPSDARGHAVKGFYVTLDKDFAIESKPSEWNAWKSYEYTNVGIEGKTAAKLFNGKQGSISINSEDAMGDIIGFRVYVVNLDGTLVDPDGRAFYVRVGEQKTEADLIAKDADVKLTDENGKLGKIAGHWGENKTIFTSGLIEVTEDAFAGVEGAFDEANFGWQDEKGNFAKGWHVTVNPTAYGNNGVYPEYYRYDNNGKITGTGDYKVVFYKSDKKTKATKFEDIKYAEVQILVPVMFLDDAAYTVRTTLFDENKMEVRDLKLSFTKVMPTEANINALAWVNEFDPTLQVFTNKELQSKDIYKISYDENTGKVIYDTPEAVRLFDKMTGLTYGAEQSNDKSKSWYTLVFSGMRDYINGFQYMGANVDKTGNDKAGYDVDGDDTDYKLIVKNSDDINGESRDIYYMYDFGFISLKNDPQTAKYQGFRHVLTSDNKLAMTFNSWVDFEKIEWGKDGKGKSLQPVITYAQGGEGKTVWPFQIGSYTTDETTIKIEYIPVQLVRTENGQKVKYDVYEYADSKNSNISSVKAAPYVVKDVVLDGKKQDVTYYRVVTVSSGEATETGTVLDAKDLAKMFPNGFTTTAVTNIVETEVPAGKHNATNPLLAWNEHVSNYINLNTIFGNSDKKVEWTSLTNTYLTDVKVSFEPASLYDVKYDNATKTVTFTQKLYSATPTSDGKLTLKAKDCFGHEWTKSVDIKINR